MKKIVSLILALVMVFALATTASAAIVVGDDPRTDFESGWTTTEFDDEITNSGTGIGSNVVVQVTAGSVQHRYAVDVEYTNTSLAIYGENLVWDVVNLEYVNSTGGPATGLEGNTAHEIGITVKNRSDMPIIAAVAANDLFPEDGGTADGIKFTVTNSSLNVAAATTGHEAVVTTTVQVAPADSKEWDDVRDYYAAQLSGATPSINVGSISVTISRPTP